MAEFPENSVKVFEFADLFRTFQPGDVRSIFEDVRSALTDAVEPFDSFPPSVGTKVSSPPPTVRNHVNQVSRARQQLLSFFQHPAMTAEIPALSDSYTFIQSGKFGPAHDVLAAVGSHPDLPPLTSSLVELAYSGPISYRARVKTTEFPGDPDAGNVAVFDVTRTISQGYEGPKVPPSEIVRLNEFTRKGTERKLLLNNEALRGLGRPQDLIEAIHSYAELLPEAVTEATDVLNFTVRLFQRYVKPGPRQAVSMPGIFTSWTSPPQHMTAVQKFAALRSGFAYIELGDILLRQHRVVAGADRDRLGQIYSAAARLVADSGISRANALRGQIEAHAARQRRKLQAGYNALGLSESFVPVMRYSPLARAAEAAISELGQSAREALTSLRSAEDLIGEKLQLVQEQNEEELRTSIYLDRIDIARLAVDKAEEQVELIEDQRDSLAEQTMSGLFSRIASADPKQMVGVAVAGAIEAGVSFHARRTELGHQLEIAKYDVDIALIQSEISVTEEQLSRRRIEHLKQREAFLTNRQVDADLYLTLAELHAKRAVRVLDAAIFLTYLAERALVFARGEELPLKIRFDYWENPAPGVIAKPELLDPIDRLNKASIALEEDFHKLARVDHMVVEDENLQTFAMQISLKEQYPLEFARLLQDGETYFQYSLYQLSKSLPISYKCRLYAAAVQVNAVGPVGGPQGVLEHTGTFLLRHKKSTLTEATRLVPTDVELQSALQRQRTEGEGIATVGGVLYYVLERDPLVITINSPLISENVPDDLDLLPEGLRKALEGYGPTGLWRLELFNLDELRITDITVHFGLIAAVDTGRFQSRIEELVHEYEGELAPEGESLDKISAFSLQELDRFVDLRTGTATLILDRDSFPPEMVNMKFKGLVAQAVDGETKGVEGVRLRYGRADMNFERERVTTRGGFSEDFDAGPEILPSGSRFPVEGEWQVELLDRDAQFPQLGDLRLFVMYSYQ